MNEPSKIENCLYAFLEVGMNGLRQLEVASPLSGYNFINEPGQYWSSCLNTDVAELGKQGITIVRRADPYIRPDGSKAGFKRYWLKDRAAAQIVLALLNTYRVRRNAEALSDDVAAKLIEQLPAASRN